MLLREGADIHAVDNEKHTPLHLAHQMRKQKEPIPHKSLNMLEKVAKEPRAWKSVSSAGKDSVQSKTKLRRHPTTSSRSSEGSEFVIVGNAASAKDLAKELPALPPPEAREPFTMKDFE